MYHGYDVGNNRGILAKWFESRVKLSCGPFKLWSWSLHPTAWGLMVPDYSSKNCFLPIFVHLVNLAFTSQIFRNARHWPSKSFPLTKVASWYFWIQLWNKNCDLYPYLVMWGNFPFHSFLLHRLPVQSTLWCSTTIPLLKPLTGVDESSVHKYVNLSILSIT